MNREADGRFQDYVAARSAALRRLAYLLCSDWHHAEDLVQSALTKAYSSWRRVERSDNVDAYIRRILVNEATDGWHRRRRLTEVHNLGLDRATSRDPMADVDQRDELLRFLAELPAKQRAVLVLRFYEDLPAEAISELLGISTGTVKSHTSRGLARLRELHNLSNPERSGT